MNCEKGRQGCVGISWEKVHQLFDSWDQTADPGEQQASVASKPICPSGLQRLKYLRRRLLTSFLEPFSCRDFSCRCWSLLTSIQPRSMSDTVWWGREQKFIFTHVRTERGRFLTYSAELYLKCQISYLGVQQIEADSVVHDITVVRCVPVAAKTKSSLTNPIVSQTSPCCLPVPEMLLLTFPTCDKNRQKESEVVWETNRWVFYIGVPFLKWKKNTAWTFSNSRALQTPKNVSTAAVSLPHFPFAWTFL